MKRLLRIVVSLAVLFGLVFGTVSLVRLANGDFAGDYALSGTFPRAGEGLNPGSAVVFRGVQVGRVSTISLEHNLAQITVLIEPSFKVPSTATATVQPVNLFGAEQVSISTPDKNSDAGPVSGAGRLVRPCREQRRVGRPLRRGDAPLEQDRHHKCVDRVGRAGTGLAGRGPQDRRLHQRRNPVGRAARPDAQRADPCAAVLRQVHAGDRTGSRRPQQPQRSDQCRPAIVQRGGGRLREPPQHADPVLQPPRRAALDVPPGYRDHSRIGRQRLAGAARTAGLDRPGHQRRLPLLPEDRRGCVRPQQVAGRQHVRLLQHLHSLQRRQQPGLQSDRTADRWHVVPAADSAGAGRERLGLQLLLRARDVQRTPEQLDAGDRRRQRRRRPRSRPGPAAPPRPRPTRPTAWSGSPISPRRPTSVASSPSFSGACREQPPRPEVGVQVHGVRRGLSRPAGRTGGEDREHLAVQQPAHH